MVAKQTELNDGFLALFHAGNVTSASAWIDRHSEITQHAEYGAHPLLKRFVDENDGHCYKASHLQIADLLTPERVRQFRDAVIADEILLVKSQLDEVAELSNAEFTAGRGIARAIHHWNSIAVAEALLAAGADLQVLTTRGESPIAMQARFGSIDGVRFLLDNGADPNHGDRPHIASANLVGVIELLLAHGWDIQTRNQMLHDANHGHGERVQTWLRFGVDPNISQDSSGQTALHLLAQRGAGREAICALVASGAEMNAKDHSGSTPLELARQATKRSAEETLLSLTRA